MPHVRVAIIGAAGRSSASAPTCARRAGTRSTATGGSRSPGGRLPPSASSRRPVPLSQPARPDIPGLDSFAGAVFHSAHWRHDHSVRSGRVAVIGTGASAAQFIPAVQQEAAQLDVYQRTPGWVMPRPDRAHSKAERCLFRRLPFVQRALRSSIYYAAETLVPGLVHDQRLLALPEALGRWHLRRQVRDPFCARSSSRSTASAASASSSPTTTCVRSTSRTSSSSPRRSVRWWQTGS